MPQVPAQTPKFVPSPSYRPSDGEHNDPSNPSLIEPYPPTLPVEIALRVLPVPDICKAYGIDRDEWNRIRVDPLFIEDLRKCLEDMKQEGMTFKMKARLQSTELLKTSWNIIHDTTGQVPPAVKAALIKDTVRWAGYDNKEGAAGNNGQQNAFQINIHM